MKIDLPLTLEPCLGQALSIELLSARLQAERNAGCDLSFTLDRLAQELEDQGQYGEAEPLYREALEVSRETLGDRHPNTLAATNNLGSLMQDTVSDHRHSLVCVFACVASRMA